MIAWLKAVKWRPFGVGLTLATVGFLMPLGWLPIGPQMPSALSQLPIPGDKIAHAVVFAVLMALGLWAVGEHRAVAPILVGTAQLFVLLMLYAIVIEGLQIVVPTRGAEWTDLIADGVGFLAAWSVERLWFWRLR